MDERLIITRDAFKHGRGTPQIVPDFLGQPYVDTDSLTVWHAISLDGPEYWSSSSGGVTSSNLPFIVVTDLGATPDGVTPSSYAINTAIEQASSTNKVGAVYLPGGVYLIDAPILLKDNIYLFGDGFTVLKQADMSNLKCVLQYYSGTTAGTYPNTEYNITISNLIIDGNNYTNTTYTEDLASSTDVNCGIILEHAHNCHFNDVEVRNCGFDGIVMKDSTSCERNVFSNVSVRNCGRYGVYVGRTGSNNRFDNCSLEFNGYDNARTNGPLNVWNSCRLGSSSNANGLTINNSDNIVNGCELIDNGGMGIYCAGDYTTIINNRLAGNSKNSVGKSPHILASGTGLHISNNHFVGAVTSTTDVSHSSCCVELGQHSGCLFASNSVYFNTVNSKLDLSSQFIKGLSVGDSINGVVLIDANQKPQPTAGIMYMEYDTGYMTYYNFSTKAWIRIEEPLGEDLDLIVKSLVSSTSVRANTIKASTSLESPTITATTINTTNVTASSTVKGTTVTATGTASAKKVTSTTAEISDTLTTKMLKVTNSMESPLVTTDKLVTEEIEISSLELDELTAETLASTSHTTASQSVTGKSTIKELNATTSVIGSLTCNTIVVGTNQILFSDSVPTEGTYKSGDLIINTDSSSDIFLWKYRDKDTGWVELKISTTDAPEDGDGDGTA